jgi:hypothetical protein
MYIFGLGLPRTGTNSLGSALHSLGINGECKCILNNYRNKRHNDMHSDEKYRYIIENDAYQFKEKMLTADKIRENLYILTIRDKEAWLKSIEKFKSSNPAMYEELQALDVDEYVEEVQEIFEAFGCIDRLLIIDIFSSTDPWADITGFLKLPSDDLPEFPRVNIEIGLVPSKSEEKLVPEEKTE